MNSLYKKGVIVFIMSWLTGILLGAGEIVMRFRLYEGFKEKEIPAKVIISQQGKTGEAVKLLPAEDMDKERQSLERVYALKDIDLVTRGTMILPEGETGPQSHEVAFKGRSLIFKLGPVTGKEDVFKLEILAGDKERQNLLETEILVPREKRGTMGFEDGAGNIYFLTFERLKDLDPTAPGNEKTMHVFIYERPALLFKVNPEYPGKALDQWIQGTVVLDTEIDTAGNVAGVTVIESAHPLLDEAAAAAIKQWKYKPFRLKGGMKTLMFTVTFRFELTPAPAAPPGEVDSRLKPRPVHRVNPVYPKTALKAHIQGNVVLEVVTDEKGNVKKVKAVNGHPLLIDAAVQAVKEWKYEPYIVDGEPKAVIFNEIIRFKQ